MNDRHGRRGLLLAVASLSALLACSDSSAPPAAAAATADAARDAPSDNSMADSLPSDASPVDQAAPDAAGCADELDLSPFTLDPGYCVVRRFAVDGLPHCFNLAADELWTFHPSTADPKDWPVKRQRYDAASGTLGAAETVFSFTPQIDAPADKAFGSEFLALSAGGQVAAGYTVNKTFAGEVLWGSGPTAKTVEQATGNFDAIFFDEQTLLIDGSGAGAAQEGQGVYIVADGEQPRRLIDGLGDLSGHLALGDSVLFAGGFFGTETRIYAFTRAEVAAAISAGETLTAAEHGDLVYTGSLLDAAALHDALVVARMTADLQLEAIGAIAVTVAGDAVTPGGSHHIATPGGALAFGRLATWDRWLALLLRRGTTTEIAVLRAR